MLAREAFGIDVAGEDLLAARRRDPLIRAAAGGPQSPGAPSLLRRRYRNARAGRAPLQSIPDPHSEHRPAKDGAVLEMLVIPPPTVCPRSQWVSPRPRRSGIAIAWLPSTEGRPSERMLALPAVSSQRTQEEAPFACAITIGTQIPGSVVITTPSRSPGKARVVSMAGWLSSGRARASVERARRRAADPELRAISSGWG